MSSRGGSNTKLGAEKVVRVDTGAQLRLPAWFVKKRGRGAHKIDRFEVGQCDFVTAQGAGCSNRLLFLIFALFYSFSSGV